jgi:hypothetical protein
MTYSQINISFLLNLDGKTINVITNNIANHYGITQEEVLDEVCDKEAHSIMDYITGDIRPAISLLFNKFKDK